MSRTNVIGFREHRIKMMGSGLRNSDGLRKGHPLKQGIQNLQLTKLLLETIGLASIFPTSNPESSTLKRPPGLRVSSRGIRVEGSIQRGPKANPDPNSEAKLFSEGPCNLEGIDTSWKPHTQPCKPSEALSPEPQNSMLMPAFKSKM